MHKPKLTIFLGVAGAGKGYQSQLRMDDGAWKVSFADSLRELTYDFLGYIPEDYDAFKKQTMLTLSLHGNTWFQKAKAFTGRDVLQRLGAAIRAQNPEFFVEVALAKVLERLKYGYDVVVDDCRYQNELDALTHLCNTYDFNYEAIFCNYKSDRYQPDIQHESEYLAQCYLSRGYTDLEVIDKNYD